MVTLLRTILISSAAITFSLSSPIACNGGLIRRQSIVESDLVVGQPQLLAAFGGGVHLFGQPDQFFDHLMRRDRSIVVRVQRLPSACQRTTVTAPDSAANGP
jgi:hypothetical protein